MCKCGNIVSCQGDCGCKFEVNTGCVRYTGDNLESLGIVEGDTLEVILEELNTRFSITDNASYLDIAHEYPGANCTYGGVKIMLKDRVTNDIITTEYLCTPDLSDLTGVTIVDTTYANLMTLIEGSHLVKGQQYRITDFRTIWDLPDFSDANTLKDTIITMQGDVDPIIVTATSTSTLSVIATQPSNPTDIIYYSPYYELPINSSTPTKGVILYRKDTLQNNECNWDFRVIQFKRYQDSNSDYSVHWDNGNSSELLYTFNTDYTHSFNNSLITDSVLTLDTHLPNFTGFPNIVLAGDMNNLNIKGSLQNITLIGSFAQFDSKNKMSNFYQKGSVIGSFYENTNNVILISATCTDLKVYQNFSNVTLKATTIWNNTINLWDNLTTTVSSFSENKISYFDTCTIAGGSFIRNVFSTECRHISFGNNTENNQIDFLGYTTVEDSFQNNKGQFVSNSTIGSNCMGNYLGQITGTIIGNDFGVNASNNTEPNFVNAPISSSIIGNNAYGNTFNSPIDTTTFIDGLKHNTINVPLSGLDLSTATHLYNNYSTQTSIATNDGARLTYIDNFDSRVTTYITS